MASISLESMRFYLQKSISSFNRNKLNGLLAEISLRQMIRDWGFQDKVSPGGWIVRSVRRHLGPERLSCFLEPSSRELITTSANLQWFLP
jgi:hypothetical protein